MFSSDSECLLTTSDGKSVFELTPFTHRELLLSERRDLSQKMNDELDGLLSRIYCQRVDTQATFDVVDQLLEAEGVQEHQRNMKTPFALRPAHMNVLSMNKYIYLSAHREDDNFSMDQKWEAFLCGQCCGNALKTLSIVVDMQQPRETPIWFFVLGVMCRESGPKDYVVTIELRYKNGRQFHNDAVSSVQMFYDFLETETQRNVFRGKFRDDCCMLFDFRSFRSIDLSFLRVTRFSWSKNIGFHSLELSPEQCETVLSPRFTEPKIPVRHLHWITSFPSPDPDFQRVTLRMFDCTTIESLCLEIVSPPAVEQAWLSFWGSTCPRLKKLHLEQPKNSMEHKEFMEDTDVYLSFEDFPHLELFHSVRNMTAQSLRTMPPIQHLDFQILPSELVALRELERPRLLATSCICCIMEESPFRFEQVVHAICAIGERTTHLHLSLPSWKSPAQNPQGEMGFYDGAHEDMRQYTVEGCEEVRVSLHMPTNVAQPGLYCKRMLFLMGIFSGAKKMSLISSADVKSAHGLIHFVKTLTGLFDDIKDRFQDQLPNLQMTLSLYVQSIKTDELLENVALLIPVFIELYKRQRALNIGQVVKFIGLSNLFQRLARTLQEWTAEPCRRDEFLHQQHAHLIQVAQFIGCEHVALPQTNEPLSWHMWMQDLQVLAESLCPNLMDSFCPSDRVEDDVLSLLAVILEGPPCL